MAYKDEYEVARLSIDPVVRGRVEEQFGAGSSFSYRLHPPGAARTVDEAQDLSRAVVPAQEIIAELAGAPEMIRGYEQIKLDNVERCRQRTQELLGLLTASSESNPRRAQLVFNSHDATIPGDSSGDRIIGRDQIWLTEQRTDGSTRLYPLAVAIPQASDVL